MIIKLQYPIMGNMILGYNQRKTVTFQLPTEMVTGKLGERLRAELKVYVNGDINKHGQLVITKVYDKSFDW